MGGSSSITPAKLEVANDGKRDGKKGERPQRCQTSGGRSRRNGSAPRGETVVPGAPGSGPGIRTGRKWRPRSAAGSVEALAEAGPRPERRGRSPAQEGRAEFMKRPWDARRQTGQHFRGRHGAVPCFAFYVNRALPAPPPRNPGPGLASPGGRTRRRAPCG